MPDSLSVLGAGLRSVSQADGIATAQASRETLTSLVLHANDIAAVAPHELAWATALRHLDLSSNNVSSLGAIEPLSMLTNLEHLDVSSNGMCDLGPAALRALTRLGVFAAPHNQLSSLVDLACESLTSLQKLDLRGNRIATLDDLRVLTELPSLRELALQTGGGEHCNPVCADSDYRKSVLSMLPDLDVLDGVPRDAPVATTSSFPRIDSALRSFRHRSSSASQRPTTTRGTSPRADHATPTSVDAAVPSDDKAAQVALVPSDSAARIAVLEAQLASLLAQAQQTASPSAAATSQATGEIAALQAQVASARALREVDRANAEAAERQLITLQDELSRTLDELRDVWRSLDQCRSSEAAAREQLAAVQEKQASATGTLDEQVRVLHASLAEAEGTITDLRHELAQRAAELSSRDATVFSLTEAKEEREHELTELRQQHTALIQAMARLEQAHDAAKQEAEQTRRLAAQHQAEASHQQQAQDLVVNKDAELEHGRRELHQARSRASKAEQRARAARRVIEELMQLVGEQKTALALAQQRHAEALRAGDAERQALQAQLETTTAFYTKQETQWQSQLQRLQEQQDRLLERWQDASQHAFPPPPPPPHDRSVGHAPGVDSSTAAAEVMASMLQQQLPALLSQEGERSRQLGDLQRRCVMQEDQLQRAEQAMQRLTDALRVKEKMLEDQNKTLASRKAQITQLREQVDHAQRDADAAAEADDLRQERRELRHQIAEQEHVIEQLERAARDNKDEADAIAERMKEMQDQLEEKDKRLSYVQAEVAQVQEMFEARTARQVTQLRDQLSASQAMCERLAQQVEADKLLVQRLRQRVQTGDKHVRDLTRQLEVAVADNTANAEKVAQLRAVLGA